MLVCIRDQTNAKLCRECLRQTDASGSVCVNLTWREPSVFFQRRRSIMQMAREVRRMVLLQSDFHEEKVPLLKSKF